MVSNYWLQQWKEHNDDDQDHKKMKKKRTMTSYNNNKNTPQPPGTNVGYKNEDNITTSTSVTR